METELKKIEEVSGMDPIEEAYKKTVEMVGNQTMEGRKWAYRILSWVFHACRPLKPKELLHALAVENHQATKS